MKKISSWSLLALLLLVAMLAISVSAVESKYSTTGTNAVAVTFGPSPAGYLVRGLYAKSDKSTAVCKFYTRGGSGRNPIVTASTSGAQVVYISNAAHACSTNDVVTYVHSDGTLLQTTVASSATNYVTLSTGLTKAGTTSDYLFELAQTFELPVGSSAALNPAGSWIFGVPGNSPLYTVVDCNTAATHAVTVDK